MGLRRENIYTEMPREMYSGFRVHVSRPGLKEKRRVSGKGWRVLGKRLGFRAQGLGKDLQGSRPENCADLAPYGETPEHCAQKFQGAHLGSPVKRNNKGTLFPTVLF